MKEKEISEIRRRFRTDRSNITHIQACYVNSNREIISQFNQSLALTSQEECDKILAVLKKVFSGAIGKNLIDLTFSTNQVINSSQHHLLMTLKNSELKDKTAVSQLYQTIISSFSFEGPYMILLAYDTYDVPYHAKDGEQWEEASEEVFSYFLCAICPVKSTPSALSYYADDQQLHNRTVDLIIAPPELGFMFPAFDDRCANIYNALYYSRNASDNHPEFAEAVFGNEIPMPAEEQKETFQEILVDSLGDDCSYEVVQAIHDELFERMEENKAKKDEQDPLNISKDTVKNVLKSCEVAEHKVTAFEKKYDTEFGENTLLPPKNLLRNKLEIHTPDITIHVNPERSDLIETRIIDGAKYILIRAEDTIEVNGITIHISKLKD